MFIYAFGEGDFIYRILQAIVNIMGQGSFQTLIRISVLLGVFILMWQLVFTFNIAQVGLGMLKHYMYIMIVWTVLFVPKASVTVVDLVNPSNSYPPLPGVPYGVAIFGNVFSNIERGIAQLFENSLYTAGDPWAYTTNGYAFPLIELDTLRSATTQDPYVKTTLASYLTDCFFLEVLMGGVNLNTAITVNDLWASMAPTANTAALATKVFSDTNPNGLMTSCQASYNTMNAALPASLNTALNAMAGALGRTPVQLQNSLGPDINRLLGTGAMTTQQVLQQAIVTNMLSASLQSAAVQNGLSGEALGYATAIAQQQQRSTWAVGGELSKKYMPVIRQVMLALLYGAFPIMFVLMFAPWGMTYLKLYATLFIWLCLWAPLYTILNFITSLRAMTVLTPAQGFYSLGAQPYIYESTYDLVAMAGYLSWSVPMLAFAIAKGSEYALTNVIGGLTSGSQAAASGAASQISGPDVVSKMTSAAAHFKAAEHYGNDYAQGQFMNYYRSDSQNAEAYNIAKATGNPEAYMTRLAQYGAQADSFNTVSSGQKAESIAQSMNKPIPEAAQDKAKLDGIAEGTEAKNLIDKAGKGDAEAAGKKFGDYNASLKLGGMWGQEKQLEAINQERYNLGLTPITAPQLETFKKSPTGPMSIPQDQQDGHGPGTMSVTPDGRGGAQIQKHQISEDGVKTETNTATTKKGGYAGGSETVTTPSGATVSGKANQDGTVTPTNAESRILKTTAGERDSQLQTNMAAQEIGKHTADTYSPSVRLNIGTSSAETRKFEKNASESSAANFQKMIGSDKAFRESLSREAREALEARAGAGINTPIYNAGGQWYLQLGATQNQSSDKTITNHEAQSINKAYSESRQVGIAQALQNSKTADEAISWTKTITGSDASRYLENAQMMKRLDQVLTANQLLPILQDIAKQQGIQNPTSHQLANILGKIEQEVMNNPGTVGPTLMKFMTDRMAGTPAYDDIKNRVEKGKADATQARNDMGTAVEGKTGKAEQHVQGAHATGFTDPTQKPEAREIKLNYTNSLKDIGENLKNSDTSLTHAHKNQATTPLQMVGEKLHLTDSLPTADSITGNPRNPKMPTTDHEPSPLMKQTDDQKAIRLNTDTDLKASKQVHENIQKMLNKGRDTQ